MWILALAFLLPAAAFAQRRAPVGPAPGPQSSIGCYGLPGHAALKAALNASLGSTGGLEFAMWATIVNRDGEVCAVAFTGSDRGQQWPGSRVISAQKANTANAFSLPRFALSTANLFSAVQPGGSLFGLQESNPVDTAVAYGGPGANFGQPDDPMLGKRIGGINVFGGGLALYNQFGEIVGGIGVSGDTSCADHIVAWRARNRLNLDNVPAGVGSGNTDNIIHDVGPDGKSVSGFGHPACSPSSTAVAGQLTTAVPVGPNRLSFD